MLYFAPFIFYFNSQPHKEADIAERIGNVFHGISTHSLTRRLTVKDICTMQCQHISTHSLTRRLTLCYRISGSLYRISTHSLTSYRNSHISTHSLTRRLTAILFNKNRFVQFIFITLYQSPPQPLLLPPFFHPIFSFSARISGANRPRIGWGLGVRTIGSGYR